MSSTIFFRKTPINPGYFAYGDISLKSPFSERFSDHDGTLTNGKITLEVSELPWVEDLITSGIFDKGDLKTLKKIRQILLTGLTVDWWIGY